jgi:predicted dienelactone hydrolase
MRPLEWLVLLGNLLLFLALAVSSTRTTPWPTRVAVVAIILIVVQVLSEGSRWQMFPLFLVAGVLVLLSLLLRQMPPDVAVQPSKVWQFTTVAAISMGASALALAAALPLLLPVTRLPRPSGPYEIGTLTYHWIDNERAEAFSAPSSDRRELMVQLWYPAAPSRNLPRAPYVEPGRTLAPLARLLRLPKFFFSHLQYASTNAAQAAPITEEPTRFPVLVFSHGW